MKLKQLEPVEETIGGHKFYIRPFPALKAANMTGELASLMLPVFGALAPLVKDSEDSGNGHENKEDGGLMDMDEARQQPRWHPRISIDGNKLEKMIQKFLLGGHIVVELEDDDGEPEGYKLDMDLLNEIFCGEVQDMFILCFYVLRINFSGFFGKLAGLSGKAGEGLKGSGEDGEADYLKYGRFDSSQFSELELRIYTLIKAKMASMWEMKNVYSLDEMLKLYALYEMELDVERGKAKELELERGNR